MNYKAFHKLSYGLQIICSSHNGQDVGYVANTAFQVTSDPAQIAISAHKKNLSTDIIQLSKKFTLSVLQKDVDVKLIGDFGFMTSSEGNKFKDRNVLRTDDNLPVVLDDCIAWFECKLTREIDLGSHILFIGEVVDAKVLNDKEPLTYDYYREHYKMLAPKNAPTYLPKEKLEAEEEPHMHTKEDMVQVGTKWICTICGWVYDPAEGDPSKGIAPGTPFEDLPDDYTCPICDAGKEYFKED